MKIKLQLWIDTVKWNIVQLLAYLGCSNLNMLLRVHIQA